MSKDQENYKTHTILKPKDCKCDGSRHCNICDGGLAFCTVCRGGEIELEEQTCEERLRDRDRVDHESIRYVKVDGEIKGRRK
jgi:hypothetical protein